MSTSPPSRQESQPRYWCYTCNAEVQIYMAPDLTCQQCNEQFIEEIDSENDPQSFLAGAEDNQGADRGADGLGSNAAFFRYETGDDDDIFHIYAPMAGRNEGEGGGEAGNQQPLAAMLQNLLSTMLNPAGTPGQQGAQPTSPGAQPTSPGTRAASPDAQPTEEGEAGSQQQQRRQPYLFYGSMLDGNMQFRPMNMSSQQNGEGGDMRAEFAFEMHNNQSTEDQEEARGDGNRPPNLTASLMQILSALAGGPLGEGFVGNPDDYVFSQTALDNIISQLMEQTSGRNAPPPAPEAVIDSLPKRKLFDLEIAQQTDCAVCKDEFEATEQVVELPCTHVFHDECIKPWLKVNGTCPVCRHAVVGEKNQDQPHSDHDDTNASSSQQPDDLLRRPSNSNDTSQQDPPPSASSPAQENQAADTTSTLSSLLFEGARRIYNDRSPSSGWHSSIPGPFTWGPGGRTTNNPTSSSNSNNNNSNDSSTDNDNTQQQRSNDSNNNDVMDLDLD